VTAFAVLAASAAAQNPISRASVDSVGTEGNADSGSLSRPAISADGRWVAFESTATNLVANDTNGAADIFVHDRLTGAIARVSIRSNGNQANGYSDSPAISDDGRFVVFESIASNLVAGDTNGAFDIFLHDRDPDLNGIYDEGNGVTTRVSVDSSGAQGNFDSVTPAISGNAGLVVFSSAATNFAPGDKNAAQDVFVRDVAAGTTTRLSAISGLDANGPSFAPSISSAGSVIAFSSFASNLIGSDTNGASDVFVTDPLATSLTRVSVDSFGIQGNDDSTRPAVSSDGTVVAFTSAATNLVASDNNFVTDVFVYDLASAVTTRVSVDSLGNEGNSDSRTASLSQDGQIVAFESTADNFTANDGNFSSDVFVHDRATGVTECITVNGVGVIANGFGSSQAAISDDGLIVTFASSGDNLVLGDGNFAIDVFVRDRSIVPPLASWTNYGAGFPGLNGVPTLTSSANPVFGSTITIDASNSGSATTLGLFILGDQAVFIPTNRGGAILADLDFIIPVTVPITGYSLTATVPTDLSFYGIHAYLQMIELDAGASAGFSFSQGLDLALGL
jgi:hypothetical protein